MQLLTKTLEDYIDKHKVKTAIDKRKEEIKLNVGNPLFGKNAGLSYDAVPSSM